VTGPKEADRADSWLSVELYSERLSGRMETPANEGAGRAPPGAGGSTSGTRITCAVRQQCRMPGLARGHTRGKQLWCATPGCQ
jgi:hypothetical protein